MCGNFLSKHTFGVVYTLVSVANIGQRSNKGHDGKPSFTVATQGEGVGVQVSGGAQ